ncbi:MAG: (deoxy)nucleoside triphosphate pyrophosphohydrolase [Paludibacteraceae bacterium]|nr:(deoxy)nucleoside triphosphate pyrophosphohydrolase [Paludibacteraceae bacterium]
MKRIEVVAAVILRDGKIFATQRGYGDYKDGWEFPGGKMEPGETREDAIVREIGEELATTIRVEQFLDTVEYDYPTFHITMHCFLCSVVSGQLQLLEHEDARWLDATTLHSVDWLPADVAILPKVENVLKQN